MALSLNKAQIEPRVSEFERLFMRGLDKQEVCKTLDVTHSTVNKYLRLFASPEVRARVDRMM